MQFGILRARIPQVQFTEVVAGRPENWAGALNLLQGLTPWGVRREDGLVIFARPEEPAPVPGEPFSRLDTNFNDRRRVMFESELAASVTFNDVSAGVNRVNAALLEFTSRVLRTQRDLAIDVLAGAFKRGLYDPTASYFGRLGTAADAPSDPLEVIRQGIGVLQGTTIASALGLHYAFLKIFEILKLRPAEEFALTFWTIRLNPADLLGGSRGREERFRPAPTSTAGITAADDEPVGSTAQTHARALDKYAPLRGAHEQVSAFYLDSVVDGLPFVAGPSGTTADLFRCAMTFVSLQGEEAKQHALACIAYLELAGNHSFHEIMTIASLAGVPYERGEYDPSLPASFAASGRYLSLKKKYMDVFISALVNKLQRN